MKFDELIVRPPALGKEKHGQRSDTQAPEQMIVPATTVARKDETLPVTTIESIAELAKLPIPGCISVRDKRLLKLLFAETDLFGVRLLVVTGYPEIDYTPEFDQLAWAVDRVAYSDLIAELATQKRLDDLRSAENHVARSEMAGKRANGEKRSASLTRERAKHFSDFTAHELKSGAIDDDDVEPHDA